MAALRVRAVGHVGHQDSPFGPSIAAVIKVRYWTGAEADVWQAALRAMRDLAEAIGVDSDGPAHATHVDGPG